MGEAEQEYRGIVGTDTPPSMGSNPIALAATKRAASLPRIAPVLWMQAEQPTE